MSTNHITWEHTTHGFQDMNAKTFISVHYGTFDLSDGPISEPIRILQKLHSNRTLNSN